MSDWGSLVDYCAYRKQFKYGIVRLVAAFLPTPVWKRDLQMSEDHGEENYEGQGPVNINS